MKKKTIWTLSAVLLAVVLCAVIIVVVCVVCAPDRGNGPSEETPTGGQTAGDNTGDNSGDTTGDGTDENGDTEPEIPVVTTVTEEEWKAAVTMQNVTNTKWELSNVMKGTYVTDGGSEEYSITQNAVYVRDGNFLHTAMTMTATGEYGQKMVEGMASTGQPTNTETYFDLEQETMYLKDDAGAFRKIEKADRTEADEMWWSILNPYSHIQQGVLNSVGFYAKAQYVEAEKAYSVTEDDQTMLAYFENGKLVKIVMTSENQDETQTIVFTFLYGGQRVTLPTVS